MSLTYDTQIVKTYGTGQSASLYAEREFLKKRKVIKVYTKRNFRQQFYCAP